jgi:tRNA U55 pseudouridine synthase TruB
MGIYKFYKQEGELMDELLNRFDTLVQSKRRCYTGRLDPLASGQIIILTDDDVHAKMTYCNFDKIYTFTLLHEFTTDSHDIMGLITRTNTEHTKLQPGDYNMQYPPFSNYNIKGKPYWYYTKNGIEPPFIPSKQINLSF